MRNKNTILACILLASMLILASCDLDVLSTSIDSKTPTSVETTMKATETTPAPTEATVPFSTENIVFEEHEPYFNAFSCYYLPQTEKAFVFDNSIRDGLRAQNEFAEVTLPVGTVMADLNELRPDLKLNMYPGKTLFILPDDRCVFFEQSATETGEPIYNGKPAEEFLRSMEYYYDYFEGTPKTVENYELMPNTPLDPSIAPQNIIINVDWNGDGKTDTILRECESANRTWKQKVWYTDGATGKKTDITERFARDQSEEYGGLTDYVMLFRDEKTGRYALIDCFDTCSCDYSIFVYSYDKNTIVTYTETYGVFVYEDGRMYEEYGSLIFGNLGTMRTPLVFDGKSVKTDPSVREYWWLAALVAEENGEAVPGYFSYTLQEVPVEKKTASGYENVVIPSGIAIFPKYYIWNDKEVGDSGTLYFVLADGSEYRIAFEQEPHDWDCTFGGVSQGELFHCSWGG